MSCLLCVFMGWQLLILVKVSRFWNFLPLMEFFAIALLFRMFFTESSLFDFQQKPFCCSGAHLRVFGNIWLDKEIFLKKYPWGLFEKFYYINNDCLRIFVEENRFLSLESQKTRRCFWYWKIDGGFSTFVPEVLNVFGTEFVRKTFLSQQGLLFVS